jgi:ZIP family zinc transporter
MSDTFKWIAGFAILSALVNSIGIFAIFKYREWAERMKEHFMCFAAGILISTPLILALPKAAAQSKYAGFVALGGFLFMLFSNSIIGHLTKKEKLAFGITAAEGIGIHSFIDGLIYAITFKISITVGILAGTGMVVHEFAEGVITYLVLIKGGVKEKRAMVYAFLIAALTTPVGAFIAYPLIGNISDSTKGMLLGFVGGVLLYISASHLLPEAREHEKKHSIVSFMAGVLLALFIVFSKIMK